MKQPTRTSKPLIVVGGGPIGLETAVAATRRGVPVCVLEKGSIGETMTWWAPGTRWFSSNDRIAIAGVPLLNDDQTKATREQYLTYLRSIATQFDLPIRTGANVVGVSGRPGDMSVEVECRGKTDTIAASAVVLAIGGTDRPRRLGVEGEDLPHVDGYLREVHRYFGRRVLIVGGRNSAIEAALRLHRAGARVTLSYRGEALPEESIKYWLRPEVLGLLKTGGIRGIFSSNVRRIRRDDVELDTPDGLERVDADDVLTLIGYEQDPTLFRSVGVEMEGPMNRPHHDPATMLTNRPGVYVAGTATAGTQSSSYKTFLENCHVHVERLLDHYIADRSLGETDARDRSAPHPRFPATDATLTGMVELHPES